MKTGDRIETGDRKTQTNIFFIFFFPRKKFNLGFSIPCFQFYPLFSYFFLTTSGKRYNNNKNIDSLLNSRIFICVNIPKNTCREMGLVRACPYSEFLTESLKSWARIYNLCYLYWLFEKSVEKFEKQLLKCSLTCY